MSEPRQLDLAGLACPLPLLKTKKALVGMAPGEQVEVRATDPGAREDFAAFCRQTGHRLLSLEEEGDVLVIRLQKAEEA